MTDIHVVISEYERWLSIYKTNEELRKAVDAWYYYCQEWYEQHSYEEPRWVSVKDRLPEPLKDVEVVSDYLDHDEFHIAMYNDGGFWQTSDCQIIEEGVWKWRDILTPEQEAERSKGCPNLRSWLAGCPVEGLRDATLEWQTQREKDLQATHQRVEEAKQALCQAIEEEVKLNKF